MKSQEIIYLLVLAIWFLGRNIKIYFKSQADKLDFFSKDFYFIDLVKSFFNKKRLLSVFPSDNTYQQVKRYPLNASNPCQGSENSNFYVAFLLQEIIISNSSFLTPKSNLLEKNKNISKKNKPKLMLQKADIQRAKFFSYKLKRPDY
ncbi:MAG: hypothetical protein WCK02_02910 [Bacteroidota bacterium]